MQPTTHDDVLAEAPPPYGNERRWLTIVTQPLPEETREMGLRINPIDLMQINPSNLTPAWITLGNHIYRAVADPLFPIGQIGVPAGEVSPLARCNIPMYHQCLIGYFHSGEACRNLIQKASILLVYRPFAKESAPLVPPPGSLEKILSEHLRGQFIHVGKTKTIALNSGYLDLQVVGIIFSGRFILDGIENRTNGLFHEKSSLQLLSNTPETLPLLADEDEELNLNLRFEVSLETEVEQTDHNGSPMIFQSQELASLVRDTAAHEILSVGKTFKIKPVRCRSLTIRTVRLNTPFNDPINERSVRLSDQYELTFQSSTPFLFIATGCCPAAALDIKIFSAYENDTEDGQKKPSGWVAASHLERSLRGYKYGFVDKMQLALSTSYGTINLLIEEVHHPQVPSAGEVAWTIGPETQLNFVSEVKMHPTLRLETPVVPIVDNTDSYPLRSITFELSAPEWVRFLPLPISEVMQSLNPLAIDSVTQDQLFTFTPAGTSHTLTARVKSCRFNRREVQLSGYRYNPLGRITPLTTISLEEKSPNLSIISKSRKEVIENMRGTLKELGIGAAPQELIKYLQTLLLTSGPERDDLDDLNIRPPKGIILHGPPGTGKTKIAELIGKITQTPKSRISLHNAPNLLSKWRGEPERRIKEIFTSAGQMSENVGPDAPPAIIIFDEINAIASTRGGSTCHDTIVEALLTAIAGLDAKKNVFVIGITNRLDLLDDAVKRPGRLYPHISINPPDASGREEIFDVYLNKLRKSGRLSHDINLKALAANTEGFTGAQIESIVQDAMYSTLTAATLPEGGNQDPNKFKPISQVILIRAIEVVKKQLSHNQHSMSMYS